MISPGPAPPASQPKRVLLAVVWDEPEHEIGIARYARNAGWIMTKIVPGMEQRLHDWQPDGIICQLHPSAESLVDTVRTLDVPTVDMSHFVPEMNVPRVRKDSYGMGTMAARHFLDRGFTQFCYIGLVRETSWKMSYYYGFLDAITEAGFAVQPIILDDPASAPGAPHGISDRVWMMDDTSAACQQWFGRVMLDIPKPVGIFAWNYNYCIDLVEGCLAAGILIPEEISVVTTGTRDIECEFASVPLSCIIPDYETQGYQAALVLDQLMRGEPASPDTSFIPPKKLIVRESSDIYAVDHLDTARVIRFVMRNLSRTGLSATDVMRETGVSQWKLYHVIPHYLGCPIAMYIEQERLKQATTLMRTTSLSLTAIAEQCGFTDLKHFRRTVKRLTGLPPRDYREHLASTETMSIPYDR